MSSPETLVRCLMQHVETRGDKVFTRHVSSEETIELSFQQFFDRASSFASFYAENGLVAGEVALIFLPTSPDTFPAFVGAMLLGAIPSFMPCPSAKQHPSVYWPSHKALLARIGARVVVTDRLHASQMREHGLGEERIVLVVEDAPAVPKKLPASRAVADDIALLQHSSGTTSLKKGVALSHRAILAQAASYAARLGASDRDNIVSWLPLYHDMGLIACSILPLVLGQTVTILDPFQWVARPASLFEAIEKNRGHFVWLPNFSFEHLARAVPPHFSADLSHVRAFIDCSEPCKAETFDRFAQRFASLGVRPGQLQVCYAMAETVFAISQTTVGEPVQSTMVDRDLMQRERVVRRTLDGSGMAALSAGRPIDGIDVQIRDGETVVGEGHVGEIVVSGDFLFGGYYNDPKTTNERLDNGFYHTRDLGFLLEGELYVLGRKDDLLIVRGRNLHAHEVEEIVGSVAGLKAGRAVAFGIYNAEAASEELIVVAEREAEAVDSVKIGRAVRDLIFDQTNIEVKDFRIVEPGWLVKTTSGKISREKNQAKYLADVPQQAAASRETLPAVGDAFATIAAIIARLFRVPVTNVVPETVAADVPGWDSLMHATLILEIEQALDIAFRDDEIFTFECVGELADRASELRAGGTSAPSRVAFEDERFAIVRFGEAGDEPDIIVFAGLAARFGGVPIMDFSSLLGDSSGLNRRKFFVSDKEGRWYTSSFDEISTQLNLLSDRPKILIGNSMGGYAALQFASRLDGVIGVLAFVPQSQPKPAILNELPKPRGQWTVSPRSSDARHCIIFGELEDRTHKKKINRRYGDNPNYTLCHVPNCGHNVVEYLHSRGLLTEVLGSTADPVTMGTTIARLTAKVELSKENRLARIESRKKKLMRKKKRQRLRRRKARLAQPAS